MPLTKPNGHSPASPITGPRSDAVAAAIRRRIVDGEFAPGSQLPTWDELGETYGVGRNTLVRAIAQLKHQRFIYSSSTRGTYVAERPPHLSQYVLLFRDTPGHDDWSQFWHALSNQVAEFQGRGVGLSAMYGVRNEHGNAAHDALLQDVATDQYAGLIFVSTPERISRECLAMPGLPKVGICAHTPEYDLPNVGIDRQSFVTKSLDWLSSRGRRRIAVLAHYAEPYLELFPAELRKRGLECRPEWMLPASGVYPPSANPIVRLLLSGAQRQLPDALIVANDNLVDESLAATVAMGKRVPEDLQVLTHCNWPTPRGSHVLRTCRLGFDVRQILSECLGIIDRWRRGKGRPPRQVNVPAVFEEELRDAAIPWRMP